ncbi:helix-turn-helix domain-containing protein [Devosia sp. LjRoot16]|jgi:hypothetical protein|uniref:Crp/Fnr family transcriptional regulator n=1 Tax=Devosia sp. LjRoot16 TaxID=3342271 RepID=UPI003ECEE408
MSDGSCRNLLLRRLAPADLQLLQPERVSVELRQPFHAANSPIIAIYFPEDCVASVVANVGRGSIEVGLIGFEGVTSSFLVSGDRQSPFETFAQANGTAYRVDIEQAVTALDKSDTLRSVLSLYHRAFELQVTATSVTNGYGQLEERLARWLLMVSDRLGQHFDITHDLLATMLAVRRSGVTVAIQLLEGDGLIRSTRGHMVITDREGLLARANGAYGLAEREYSRLLGEP